MRDVLPDLKVWFDNNKTVALATVVKTWGSAPRKIGAHMAITGDGEITGSVSGGCVEGSVIEAAYAVLQSAQPQLLHFGVSDEESWEVGLACGGEIDVFVQPLPQNLFADWAKIIDADQPLVYTTAIAGPHIGATQTRSDRPTSNTPYQSLDGDSTTFTNIITPAPTLVIVGGVQIAISLAHIAKLMDFKTVLIDPRKTFASQERFPMIDLILSEWPDTALQNLPITSSTAVAVLTHDPKLDDPALITALNSSAFYIGVLGSRRTQEKRNSRLLEAGITKKQLENMHGPIGLKIGANSPEEIALSIMAQIIEVWRR